MSGLCAVRAKGRAIRLADGSAVGICQSAADATEKPFIRAPCRRFCQSYPGLIAAAAPVRAVTLAALERVRDECERQRQVRHRLWITRRPASRMCITRGAGIPVAGVPVPFFTPHQKKRAAPSNAALSLPWKTGPPPLRTAPIRGRPASPPSSGICLRSSSRPGFVRCAASRRPTAFGWWPRIASSCSG